MGRGLALVHMMPFRDRHIFRLGGKQPLMGCHAASVENAAQSGAGCGPTKGGLRKARRVCLL